jgi:hypothetical protein
MPKAFFMHARNWCVLVVKSPVTELQPARADFLV